MVPAATPAAHPDLSGIWTTYIEPGAPPPARQRGPAKLPFTAAAQAKVDAYRALVGPGGDSPGAHCLGSGMPESMTFSGGYPMEIIQRPEQITIIYEAHSEIRRLYFASKVIAPGDRVPARNGYSIAHWEGDTLVVETTSLKEQEDSSYPHSEQAQILERYHLTKSAKGTPVLVDDWVLTDPAFYTEPVSRQKKWALDPKGILLPYECDEETWLDHLEDLKKAAAARSAAPH
ncbi:MAG TPA: hypothetical protein VLW26_03280 [Steroidobacteraceae bacterium]|nr:hypothetical protein [Steroidobacteraceae bacterium]